MTDTPPAAILERGQTIDRFVVLGLVGRGGMGEVYAAYDPELDRKVAIKLLRGRSADAAEAAAARTRLLREAQAIAKLSHPNIVVVYDVGTFGDSVFIAMEFVDGKTIGYWLQAETRPWREVLKVFLAAGRGLAAAHGAGLVHRDFKPENVMLTADGQVRVMDFGLARQIGETSPDEPLGAAAPASEPAAGTPGPVAPVDLDSTVNLRGGNPARSNPALEGLATGRYLSLKLTQTGVMLGTPAYMAPEQFAVRAGDARTDQFSFCVALYEGLYGQRPFAGDSFLTLMTAVTTGAVGDPPARTRVPPWIRKVLLRGLETDPEARFPSMPALLTALETDPNVRARRAGAGVAVLACLAAFAVGARRVAGSHEAVCRGGAQRLAGVWEPGGALSARKQAVRRSFAATGRSYAERAFGGAALFLDQYVTRWVGMYTDACEATARGEQSSEVLDLRMSCLQERLTSVRALTDLFANADGTVVENAVSAAGALPRLDTCDNVALLRAVVRPPEDEALRRRVEALAGERARLRALVDAGRCRDGAELAVSLLAEVRRAGYPPLLARTLDTAGFRTNACIPEPLSIERYREAFSVALAAHDDETAAESATLMAGFLGSLEVANYQAAREWLAIGQAVIARIGGHPLLESWLLMAEAEMHSADRDWNGAIAAFEKSRALKQRLLGPDHPDLYISAGNVGLMLQLAGRYEEALAVDESVTAALSRLLGPDHPEVALHGNNQAEVLNALHRYPEARALFQRSVDIWRRSGAAPFFLAYPLTGLGIAALGERRPEDAIPPLEEALRTRTEIHADPDRLGEVRFALARALASRPAARGRALALGREARADYAALKTGGQTVAEIDAWLKKPTPGP